MSALTCPKCPIGMNVQILPAGRRLCRTCGTEWSKDDFHAPGCASEQRGDAGCSCGLTAQLAPPCCDDGPPGHTQQQHHDASPCYDQACPLDHPKGGPFPHPCDQPPCPGHFPACPHRDDFIACDACIERRKAGPLFCPDLDNCAGPGCMDGCVSVYPPSATGPYSDERGWSGPLLCVLSAGHEGDLHLNSGIGWRDPLTGGSAPNPTEATGSNAPSALRSNDDER